MIDLHCHLLPGIDDGAGTMVEALEIARASVANGIEHAVLTPHLHPGRYENTRSSTAAPLVEFRNALAEEQIPLQVDVAAEVRFDLEILRFLALDEVPFLGEMDGYRILLLEFPHSHIPHGAENLVGKFFDQGIRPIIAHPERNKDVIRDLTRLEPFIEMGCFLQLTAASVAGNFGEGPLLRSRQLLQEDVFTILATDAHNLKGRRPELKEGMLAAAEILGEQAAHDLVHKNPLAILGGSHAGAT